jgi:hypothetical protein
MLAGWLAKSLSSSRPLLDKFRDGKLFSNHKRAKTPSTTAPSRLAVLRTTPEALFPLPPPVLSLEVSELALAWLLWHVKVPWTWPLVLNLEHEGWMSAVDWTSKAPLTSLRAGSETLRMNC